MITFLTLKCNIIILAIYVIVIVIKINDVRKSISIYIWDKRLNVCLFLRWIDKPSGCDRVSCASGKARQRSDLLQPRGPKGRASRVTHRSEGAGRESRHAAAPQWNHSLASRPSASFELDSKDLQREHSFQHQLTSI